MLDRRLRTTHTRNHLYSAESKREEDKSAPPPLLLQLRARLFYIEPPKACNSVKTRASGLVRSRAHRAHSFRRTARTDACASIKMCSEASMRANSCPAASNASLTRVCSSARSLPLSTRKCVRFNKMPSKRASLRVGKSHHSAELRSYRDSLKFRCASAED